MKTLLDELPQGGNFRITEHDIVVKKGDQRYGEVRENAERDNMSAVNTHPVYVDGLTDLPRHPPAPPKMPQFRGQPLPDVMRGRYRGGGGYRGQANYNRGTGRAFSTSSYLTHEHAVRYLGISRWMSLCSQLPEWRPLYDYWSPWRNSVQLTVQNERFPTCLYNTSSNGNRWLCMTDEQEVNSSWPFMTYFKIWNIQWGLNLRHTPKMTT